MKRHADVFAVLLAAGTLATPPALCQVLKGATPAPFKAATSFSKPVQLADGSVLKAGRYDVQIHFAGFGNTAEFEFFQGGVLKGRQRGEARGFPAVAPGSQPAASENSGKFKLLGIHNDATVKLKNPEIAQEKYVPANTEVKGASEAREGKQDLPAVQKGTSDGGNKVFKGGAEAAAASRAFSWGAAGFPPGTPLKQTLGRGTFTISLDSINSPAGIIAILKVAPAGAKGQLKQ
jgi:hypothetical protein